MKNLKNIEYIIGELKKQDTTQIALFSDVLTAEVKKFAWKNLVRPKHLTLSSILNDVSNCKQEYYPVIDANRFNTLCAWLDMEMKENTLDAVFILVKTPAYARDVSYSLNMNGFEAESIYFNPSQYQKDMISRSVKGERTSIIVTTDTPLKQLKIKGISHIINYHIPDSSQDYMERLKNLKDDKHPGKMISLITSQEHLKIMRFEEDTGEIIEYGEYDLDDLIPDYKFSRDTSTPPRKEVKYPKKTENSFKRKSSSNNQYSTDNRYNKNSDDKRERKPYGNSRDRDDDYLKFRSVQDGRKFVYKYKFVK